MHLKNENLRPPPGSFIPSSNAFMCLVRSKFCKARKIEKIIISLFPILRGCRIFLSRGAGLLPRIDAACPAVISHWKKTQGVPMLPFLYGSYKSESFLE